MTNKELDQKIKHAFSNAAPDVLDSILSDCQEKKGNVIIMTNTKKKAPWRKMLAGAAAAFLLIFAGTTGFRIYQSNYTVASTVSLDVNPSIEIKINEKERVLEVIPKNEDGIAVVGNMDFTGNSLDVTVNALIGSMLRNGYISELANSILISVDNEDPAKGLALQTRLTEEINAMLQTNSFSGAVLSQTISADNSLQQLADSYGITLGKAQLIQQITNQNPLYTFEDLVPLSINELNLLSESGNLNLEQVQSVGTASDKAYIGEESAKAAALSHAGLSADMITACETEMDYEHGVMVYEIEFQCNGCEYNYDIDALNGSVLWSQTESDMNPEPAPNYNYNYDCDYNYNYNHHHGHHYRGIINNNSVGSGAYIGEDAAKSTALSHAGLASDAIYEYECKLDEENGNIVYEIEFKSGTYEYSYDIDAFTGAVIKYEKEYNN